MKQATGRVKADNSSNDPFTATSSTAEISGRVSDKLNDCDQGTQQVYVPVRWLLDKTGGVHDSGDLESGWNIGEETALSPMRNYLLKLLENER